jgi:hypothetical protein
MGRPLKIQKYNTSTSTPIDQAYPPFSQLIAPTPPTGANPPWIGVVGGKRGTAVSATYPVVECQVNIALPSGTGQGVSNGVILRQKGSRKFLVMSSGTTVQDESIVSGGTYYIATTGSTNWLLFGAPAGYGVGTIFTATANGSNSGNGTCYLVGQCVLDNTTSPTVGNMAITFSYGDSSAMYVSKLTNRFLQDFNGGETGGNANTGNVWNPTQVINNKLYDANFFTDEGTEAKSGAATATWAGTQQNSNGTLNMAIVENYTS